VARQTRKTIESWVEDIENNGRDLTEWELEFMDMMYEKVAEGEPISENAEGHIENIHRQRCK
jgi:hypothetical protein